MGIIFDALNWFIKEMDDYERYKEGLEENSRNNTSLISSSNNSKPFSYDDNDDDYCDSDDDYDEQKRIEAEEEEEAQAYRDAIVAYAEWLEEREQ